MRLLMRLEDVRSYEPRRSGGRGQRRKLAGWAVLGCLSLAWAAPAQADPLYDTQRIIQPQHNECVGKATASASCETIRSRLTRVGKGRSERVKLTCPAAYPYVVGWDAKRHEHLELHVVPSPLPPHPSTSGKLRSLTVAALNKADMAGSFRVYVGCSNRPYAGGGFMRSAQAFPSKPLLKLGDKS